VSTRVLLERGLASEANPVVRATGLLTKVGVVAVASILIAR
jgi:hypothetical protein